MIDLIGLRMVALDRVELEILDRAIAAESKLSEVEAQKPVAEIVKYKDYDGDIYKDTKWLNGGPQTFNIGDKLYLQPIANNSEALIYISKDSMDWLKTMNSVISGKFSLTFRTDDAIDDYCVPLFSEQVTPNKAEVPDAANEKMLAAGIESLDRGMQNFPENMTQVISNVWEDMYAASFPPLKGDDK